MPADDYSLPTSFYFRLEFTGPGMASGNAFQEAGGLSVELEVEEAREGRQNMFKHRFPAGAKYANLVLKRGLLRRALLNAWVATPFLWTTDWLRWRSTKLFVLLSAKCPSRYAS